MIINDLKPSVGIDTKILNMLILGVYSCKDKK